MTPDRAEYRPGERAALTFALTDELGKPAPGAISLAAVDEAVFGVLDRRPGLERTFFTLEQELLKPVYEIKDWSPEEAGVDDLVRARLRTSGRSSNRRCSPARPAGPEDANRAIKAALGNDPDIGDRTLQVLQRPDWEQLAESARLPANLIAELRKEPARTAWSSAAISEKIRTVESRPNAGHLRDRQCVGRPRDRGLLRRARLDVLTGSRHAFEARDRDLDRGCPDRAAAAGGPVGPRGGTTSPGGQ